MIAEVEEVRVVIEEVGVVGEVGVVMGGQIAGGHFSGGSTSGDGDENTLEDSGSPGSNRVQLDRGQNSGQNRGQNKKRVDDAVGGNDEGKKKTGDCFVTFCYKL